MPDGSSCLVKLAVGPAEFSGRDSATDVQSIKHTGVRYKRKQLGRRYSHAADTQQAARKRFHRDDA